MPKLGETPTSESIKNWVQVIAILVAGAWATYTFWYENRYLPQAKPPQLTTSVTIERFGSKNEGSKDEITSYGVLVNVKNTGGVKAILLGAYFNAFGVPVDRDEPTPWGFATGAQTLLTKGEHVVHVQRYYPAKKFENERSRDIISTGRFLKTGTVIEAGQQLSHELSINVPRGAEGNVDYDMLEFLVNLQYAKKIERVGSVVVPLGDGAIHPVLFLKSEGIDFESFRIEEGNFSNMVRFCPEVNRERVLWNEEICKIEISKHKTIRDEDGIVDERIVKTISLWK